MTLWTAGRQASLSSTIYQSLLKLMSIESMRPSNHLILCHSLLFLHSIFLRIRVFSNESFLHIRWPKYWSFSFTIPMNIQVWFPLGWTGWIFLQYKGLSGVFSNTTVQKPQFLGAQPSLGPTLTSVHDYSKYHSSDYTHLVSKVTSLLFKTLSRFVRAFLNAHIFRSSWWNLSPNVMVSDGELLGGVMRWSP